MAYLNKPEQIAALTKTLTESLIAQQKAQIDFQKQMLVQQERFEALVIQPTKDNRVSHRPKNIK